MSCPYQSRNCSNRVKLHQFGDDFLAVFDNISNVMLQVVQPHRENDFLIKSLPQNILDGTACGGGTVLVDGTVL